MCSQNQRLIYAARKKPSPDVPVRLSQGENVSGTAFAPNRKKNHPVFPFASIFPQLSRKGTMRLKTSWPSALSVSTT